MVDRSRLRFLRIILGQPHRYRRVRALTMGVTFAALFGVPLSGLVRLDLWGGDHRALGAPAAFVPALKMILMAIAGFYVVTFLINLPAGRMFCGFGCPVGQLSRFADAIDAFPADVARRHRGWVELIGFAVALSLAVSLWWASPAAFVSGLPGVALLATVVLVAALAVLHGRRWRWNFCRQVCPIGLYYSVVQTNAPFGIDFDPTATCIDCDACRGICPAHLDPRRLGEPLPSPGGLAIDDLPALNHCLHCGACVEVCEHVTRKREGPAAMGMRMGRRTASTAAVNASVVLRGDISDASRVASFPGPKS